MCDTSTRKLTLNYLTISVKTAAIIDNRSTALRKAYSSIGMLAIRRKQGKKSGKEQLKKEVCKTRTFSTDCCGTHWNQS